MDILLVIFTLLTTPYLLSLIFTPFYFRYGIGKWFYHDIMGWHVPDETKRIYMDDVNTHAVCKHCGRDIMQDSQGNWFCY